MRSADQLTFREYSGMSRDACSYEAERLAARGWYRNFERLAALREIMARHADG